MNPLSEDDIENEFQKTSMTSKNKTTIYKQNLIMNK
jgi:hypothetical protein